LRRGIKGEAGGTNHAHAIEIENFSSGATNTAGGCVFLDGTLREIEQLEKSL